MAEESWLEKHTVTLFGKLRKSSEFSMQAQWLTNISVNPKLHLTHTGAFYINKNTHLVEVNWEATEAVPSMTKDTSHPLPSKQPQQ